MCWDSDMIGSADVKRSGWKDRGCSTGRCSLLVGRVVMSVAYLAVVASWVETVV